MGNSDLSEFEPMWTTERDNYALLDLRKDNGCACYAVLWVPEPTVCSMELIDDDIGNAVVEKMLEAGVRVLDRDEFVRYMEVVNNSVPL